MEILAFIILLHSGKLNPASSQGPSQIMRIGEHISDWNGLSITFFSLVSTTVEGSRILL